MANPGCLRQGLAMKPIIRLGNTLTTKVVDLPADLAYSSSNWQRRVVELDEVLFQFQTAAAAAATGFGTPRAASAKAVRHSS